MSRIPPRTDRNEDGSWGPFYTEAEHACGNAPESAWDAEHRAFLHRLTQLEDEELFIGVRLAEALGWNLAEIGPRTLDQMLEEVHRLRVILRTGGGCDHAR